MKKYKAEVLNGAIYEYAVYKQVFIFFWEKVGTFSSYGVEASIVEQATALIHFEKPYYFEA
jgi:hypothetical protein